jgi:hypothetical protein
MSDPSSQDPARAAGSTADSVAPDSAVDDLKRERDAFIQQFFRKGAQFTDELLRENQRLRAEAADQETENSRLRSALASNEAIRDLIKKIEMLESEKKHLLSKSKQMTELTDEFNNRYTEVETELSNLASLHVATSQLHAARSVRRVLRNLRELLGQLLGAGSFAIYLATEDRGHLIAVAHEGNIPESARRISIEDTHIGGVFMRGEIEFDPSTDPSRGNTDGPAVIVPLHLEIPADPGAEPPSVRQPLGAIVIFSTLEQKAQIWPADVELFKLLASHAGPAIVHALLFEKARASLLATAPHASGHRIPGKGHSVPPGMTLAGQLLAAVGGES